MAERLWIHFPKRVLQVTEGRSCLGPYYGKVWYGAGAAGCGGAVRHAAPSSEPMHIDTPTVLVALLIGYSMLVLDLAVARRSLLSRQPALRHWLHGSVLILIGMAAIPLRQWIPFVVGVLITNGLMTAGMALYARAIWLFVLKREMPMLMWLFAPFGVSLLSVAAVVGTPYPRLIAMSSAVMALQIVPMVVVLVRHGWWAESSLRTVACTLSLTCLALALRALHAEIDPGDYVSIGQRGWIQGFVLLAGFISSVGAGFGFVLACLERAAQQMEQLASQDGLTGCLNRTVTQTMLGHALERCRRDRQPLALVLFDLDHFKRVNDVHGHLVGDQVLREFAQAVRGRIRASDVFGRTGGEEFCLGLPNTTRDGAWEVVESVRSSVADARFMGRDGRMVQVTVSAGISAAAFHEDRTELSALTVEALYGDADDQLYRAKRQGRNQVAMV